MHGIYCLNFDEFIPNAAAASALIVKCEEESAGAKMIHASLPNHIHEDGILPILEFLKNKKIGYLTIKGVISNVSMLMLINAIADIQKIQPHTLVINIAHTPQHLVQMLFEAVCENKEIKYFLPQFDPLVYVGETKYAPTSPPGDEYADAFIYLLEHWTYGNINLMEFHFSDSVLRRFLNCDIQMPRLDIRLNNTETADLFIRAVLSPQHNLRYLKVFINTDQVYDDVGNNLNNDNYLWNTEHAVRDTDVIVAIDNCGSTSDNNIGLWTKDTVIDKSYINEYYNNGIVCVNNVYKDDDDRDECIRVGERPTDTCNYGIEVKNMYTMVDKRLVDQPLIIFGSKNNLKDLNCVWDTLGDFKSVRQSYTDTNDVFTIIDKLKGLNNIVSCGFYQTYEHHNKQLIMGIAGLIRENPNIQTLELGAGCNSRDIANLIGHLSDCGNITTICLYTDGFVPNYENICKYIERNTQAIVKSASKK